jgi:uncharacterized protein (TIGR00269 family)
MKGKMRCTKCNEKAVISIRSRHRILCEKHFLEYFINTVEQTIRKYSLIKKKDKVLVAVSGGKDSLTLCDVLLKLGYDVSGLYIDLGIERQRYSKESRRKVEKFSSVKGVELNIVDLKKEYGVSVPLLARRSPRSVCSVCGIVKRHEMNRIAFNNNYDVLATGHNLDDEVSVLMSNLLHWNFDLISRQSPRLEGWHPKLSLKVKPLCLLTEKETAMYAITNDIDYMLYDECPFSEGSTSITIKEALNRIEDRSPSTKLYFYTEFLKHRSMFESLHDRSRVSDCEVCGFPTTSKKCAFCRIIERG